MLGSHRNLVRLCYYGIYHLKLYPYTYLQEASFRRLSAALCGRVLVYCYGFGLHHPTRPICIASVDSSWLRERHIIGLLGTHSKDRQRREYCYNNLVACHLLCKTYLFTFFPQAHFPLARPKQMVVGCNHIDSSCWYSQRSRFFSDLPVLHS